GRPHSRSYRQRQTVQPRLEVADRGAHLLGVLAQGDHSLDLPDQVGAALFERGDRVSGRRRGRRRRFANVRDGGGDLLRVLGYEGDGLAVVVQRLVPDGWSDGAIGRRRDAGELGDLEVGGAELFEKADETVCVCFADMQELSAELLPILRVIEI